MNRKEAEEIGHLLREANSHIQKIADLSQQNFSGEEKKVWIHHAGHTLAQMYFEIIEPIMAKYPDLFPELNARGTLPKVVKDTD
jgi:hypothetical protein